ncbi:hypothetical protein FKM82_009895 [Ascaphus truei]
MRRSHDPISRSHDHLYCIVLVLLNSGKSAQFLQNWWYFKSSDRLQQPERLLKTFAHVQYGPRTRIYGSMCDTLGQIHQTPTRASAPDPTPILCASP